MSVVCTRAALLLADRLLSARAESSVLSFQESVLLMQILGAPGVYLCLDHEGGSECGALRTEVSVAVCKVGLPAVC